MSGAVSLYKVGVSLGDLTCMTRLADVLSEPPTFMNVGLAEQLYNRAGEYRQRDVVLRFSQSRCFFAGIE